MRPSSPRPASTAVAGRRPRRAGVLGRDLAELVALLGLDQFDLAGFSLGARTVVQGIGDGLRPRRALLAGMGLDGLLAWSDRRNFFLDAIAAFDTASRGDPHWLAIQFMKTMKIDLAAAVSLLESFRSPPPGWQASFVMPTLILCGDRDNDNGDPQALAAALPDARHVAIPGTHMSSVTQPEMGDELVRFLA